MNSIQKEFSPKEVPESLRRSILASLESGTPEIDPKSQIRFVEFLLDDVSIFYFIACASMYIHMYFQFR